LSFSKAISGNHFIAALALPKSFRRVTEFISLTEYRANALLIG